MKKLYKARRVNDFDRAMREKYSLSSLDLIANGIGSRVGRHSSLSDRATMVLMVSTFSF